MPGSGGRDRHGLACSGSACIASGRNLVVFVQPALINGPVGLILAPRGKLSRALTFTFTNAKSRWSRSLETLLNLPELDIAVLQLGGFGAR
jgi:hypothetical protein